MKKFSLSGVTQAAFVVMRHAPSLVEHLVPVFRQIEGLCEYLHEEYKKYSKLMIVYGGKSCEFIGFVASECGGVYPRFECQEYAEVVQPLIDEAINTLKLALLLGCAWAKDEAERLKIDVNALLTR